MKIRDLLRKIVSFLFRVFTRVVVAGQENMPAQGGCLICTNHLGVVDPALVFIYGGRQDTTALVTSKHRHNPFFKFVVNGVGGIWINRGEVDIKALRTAQDFMHSGGALGISPEGTRSRTRALIEARTGAAYLADKAQVIVVPVGITGSEQVISDWKHFRRPHLRMVIGKPFHLPPVTRTNRNADLVRNTDEIMCQIAALLPQQYHGVYAGHPRLAELLKESAAGAGPQITV